MLSPNPPARTRSCSRKSRARTAAARAGRPLLDSPSATPSASASTRLPPRRRRAAAVDGAGPLLRFRRIALPMIGPTVFFLVAMNFVYGFFETFAIVDATTRGGPAGATSILVYKVYQDGFVTLDLGSSAAQSVVLMALALFLTFAQFRFVERRVNYSV